MTGRNLARVGTFVIAIAVIILAAQLPLPY